MKEFNVVLLHDKMVDKQGKLVCTSLTLIDVHDIARSSRTYTVNTTYIAHPAPTIRKLSRTLQDFWEEGYGAEYNPKRKQALEVIEVVTDLDEAIQKIEARTGKLPKLIATSAQHGGDRVTYSAMKEIMAASDDAFLLMFGTGWGMSEELLARADYFLAPIDGPTPYNHLSVRSACAIILDRLFGK